MTEKRYYLEDFKDFTRITLRLYDNKIEHKHYDWLTDCNKIVDLLNEQDERIQKLESRLSIATQLLKQFKLYYIFMDKLEDVEEIHHWSKEEVQDE